MTKHMQGVFVSGTYLQNDTFNWTDPITGQVKPLRSLKVLVPNGDGTISRESISLPAEMAWPQLKPGTHYAFPVTVSIDKKKQILRWTLRADCSPLPAPLVA